jgi:hypothetical protein
VRRLKIERAHGNSGPGYQAPESTVSQAIPSEPEQIAVVSSVIAVGTTDGGHSFRRKVNGQSVIATVDGNTFTEKLAQR